MNPKKPDLQYSSGRGIGKGLSSFQIERLKEAEGGLLMEHNGQPQKLQRESSCCVLSGADLNTCLSV